MCPQRQVAARSARSSHSQFSSQVLRREVRFWNGGTERLDARLMRRPANGCGCRFERVASPSKAFADTPTDLDVAAFVRRPLHVDRPDDHASLTLNNHSNSPGAVALVRTQVLQMPCQAVPRGLLLRPSGRERHTGECARTSRVASDKSVDLLRQQNDQGQPRRLDICWAFPGIVRVRHLNPIRLTTAAHPRPLPACTADGCSRLLGRDCRCPLPRADFCERRFLREVSGSGADPRRNPIRKGNLCRQVTSRLGVDLTHFRKVIRSEAGPPRGQALATTADGQT